MEKKAVEYKYKQYPYCGGDKMCDLAKSRIIENLVKQGRPREEAEELIQETQYEVIDFINGKRTYQSIEQIIFEYSGLPSKFAWVFTESIN